MPRTAAKVTQADIARALRAIADSGQDLALEVDPDGTMRILPTPEKGRRKSRVAPEKDFQL